MVINEKVTNKSGNVDYIIKTPKKSVIPRSEKQKNYIRALKESILSFLQDQRELVNVNGCEAATMPLKKRERIIIWTAVEERDCISTGEKREKVDPYLRPLYDSLYELLDYEKIQKIEVGDIEIAPLAFMRGRTLKNSLQFLMKHKMRLSTQIKMFLTRIVKIPK